MLFRPTSNLSSKHLSYINVTFIFEDEADAEEDDEDEEDETEKKGRKKVSPNSNTLDIRRLTRLTKSPIS